MQGIILCGGQSSRMGSDKGLLMYEAKTWAQTAFENISALKIPIQLSVNLQQKNEYAKVFKPELLISDNTTIDIHGPLLGVLSAHINNPEDDLFLLACDLPLMKPDLLKKLLHFYTSSNNYEAYIFTNDNEAEPLCGIYTAKALKKIIDLYRDNKLIKHSMKFILSQLKVCETALQDDEKKYFRNFNAHADINGL